MKAKDDRAQIWSLGFLLVIAINTITSTGFYMTMPTLPKYALQSGMTLAEVGLLTGTFSIACIIVRPFAGMLADRYNRKRLLGVAVILMALATFGYALTDKPTALYAFRIMHGAAFAVTSTVQLALAADFIPENRRGEGLGYAGIAQILAMSYAPSLSLWMAGRFGYRIMFCVAAALIILAACIIPALTYRQERVLMKVQKLRLKDLFAVEMVLFALMSSQFSMSNAVTSTYLSMLADERSVTNIGLFFTVSSIAVLISKPFSGKLMDRRGIIWILIPCFLFGSGAMFLIGGSYTLAPFLVAGVLKGAAQSSGQSALQAESINRIDAARVGVALSTCYLGNDIGQGFGSIIGGTLSASVGYTSMFYVTGALVLGGFILLALQKVIDASEWGKKKYILREER